MEHPFFVDHTPPVTGNCWSVLWPFCLCLLFLSLSSFPFLCPCETSPAATLKKSWIAVLPLLAFNTCFLMNIQARWEFSCSQQWGRTRLLTGWHVQHVLAAGPSCVQREKPCESWLRAAGQALTGFRSHLRPLCIPFKCQVCSFDLAPGARRHGVRQEHLYPCSHGWGEGEDVLWQMLVLLFWSTTGLCLEPVNEINAKTEWDRVDGDTDLFFTTDILI